MRGGIMEEQVYSYLIENHVGKENLIKNKDLRKLFKINSDKSMRKVIQNIRENRDFYLIVGSISGKTGGFFICQTVEEIDETIDNIRHRANEMHRMCHILEWKKGKVLQG
jgi:hypothetical protein